MLTTKLHFPPLRTQLVPRPRLVEQLQEGLKRPLTLVSAPAGYGKTTLLVEWHTGPGAGFPAAWLSLDEDDNNLPDFLNYIAIALETAGTGLAGNTLMLLQSASPAPAEKVLLSLVDDLRGYPHDLAIVLDDYHVIDSRPVHDALKFLLEHLPPHVHLVLMTRADPPLPLPRLRVRNEVLEIRTADLRLTSGEAACFLKDIMGLDLSPADVAALEARTEGWIAGLQLAALSMQGRGDLHGFVSAFTGSHRYVVDYLAEEVLNRQPEAVRDFLLRTSILNRMTGPLCDALTGAPNGQQMLEYLERSNLFVSPLDDERTWYRYHQLFADVLRNRLQHGQPALLAELYRRAISWYEQNGLVDQAITHALAVREFDYAARLITHYWLGLLGGDGRLMLDSWMEQLPRYMVERNPRLAMLRAWLLLSEGRLSSVPVSVEQVQSALAGWPAAEQDGLASLPAELLAFRSHAAVYAAEYEPALALADQALAAASPDAYFPRASACLARSTACLEMGLLDAALEAAARSLELARQGGTPHGVVRAVLNVGAALQAGGQLHRLMDVYREALQLAGAGNAEQLSAYAPVYISQADLLYQWNDLQRAGRYLSLGQQMAEQTGNPRMVIRARLDLVRLYRAQGDAASALDLLESLQPLLQEHAGMPGIEDLHALKARWDAQLGRIGGAVAWLDGMDLGFGERLGFRRAAVLFDAARVMLCAGRLEPALALLEKMESAACSTHALAWELEAAVLQSVAWQRLGESPRAQVCLEKALALGEKEGFLRLFLDEGAPVADLLLRSNARFAARLLASFSTVAARTASVPGVQGLIEPLSDRELEVLKLIAAGRLNKEIGDELFIAIGTVKRHTANIFRKLDVINRTQAVARSRELGLL